MKVPNLFLALEALLFLVGADGQELSNFLVRHKLAIESFIMTGHGEGWKHCDILSSISVQHRALDSSAQPQMTVELKRLLDMDLSIVLSSSSCLLVSYHVNSNQSLASLIKLGWETIQRKRLALVLKMGSGVSLDMAGNTEKLPFLVAAEQENGQEQFLCPVLGETKPHLSHYMCDQSHASYKNKLLRVGMMGIPPYFIADKNGIAGIDIKLLNYLADKIEFTSKIYVPKNYAASINMVCVHIFVY